MRVGGRGGKMTRQDRLHTLLATLADATVYDLEQPRYPGMPVATVHQPGYHYLLHQRHGDSYDPAVEGPRSSASGLIMMADHTGTHIDALSHQADALTLYGGVPVDRHTETPTGFTAHGMHTVAPLVARGMLLDVAGYRHEPRLAPRYAITADDLEATAAAQGTAIRPGDVVLVRTGYGALWGQAAEYFRAAGISRAGSEWAAAHEVRAVGTDNVAWDVPGVRDEDLECTLPGHLLLLARRGIYILENLNLEEVARDHCYEFAFVCAPSKFRGATGAPVCPVAIYPS